MTAESKLISWRPWWGVIGLILFCGSAAGFDVQGNDAAVRLTSNGGTAASDEAGKNRPQLDRELEKNVLQMVDSHLPELKVLLDRLRSKDPGQYEAAIRNLANSSRRLQAAKKRGEEAFELEVEVVKARSAVNLLVAKLKLRDRAADRKALREATEHLERAELARSRYEYSVWQQRLEKMRQQVNTVQERLQTKERRFDENLQQSYENYLRKAGRKQLR
ncbi:hypothetical protein FYK55_09695 [Roseiconus nitratireducens]|uniref:Uncharacterized protein n=1 Tax=Roseiconus nitratireducens TaxID=2605748 RepID=A0A5M6DDU9_9BACT|nr:hypothetical protein [Roseiconus nitratireducens]KAA5544580.1 hypothetical protein FYK55_09695 [Roseiconus nitratireducens]